MRRSFLWLGLTAWVCCASAAERRFDFIEVPPGQTPPGFRSTVAGEGNPGEWKIVLDEVPPLLAPLTPNAPVVTKRAALAQLAQDKTDEHFPLLVFDGETYGDFTFTTRFKIVSGEQEQMAGIAFRIQDERNYYVVRASSLGNTFRFYKVMGGERGTLIGPQVEIPKGVWHDLTIECRGNQIHSLLNGKELIPVLTDNSFSRGKIGFWTKSDSVSYFTDSRVTYTPREQFAQVLIRETLKAYPRLLGLKIYAASGNPPAPRVIASTDEKELGGPGDREEQVALSQGMMQYHRTRDTASVIAPLRDRNGEVIAAVRVVMQSFPGQTEQNALARAMPVLKSMQARAPDAKDLRP